LIGSGTPDQLAGISSSVNSFDVQVIWDAMTNRFYYLMDSVFSSIDNRLSFGFNKTAHPNNLARAHSSLTLRQLPSVPPKILDFGRGELGISHSRAYAFVA